MGSACADITLQDTIVRSVRHYTMTSHGSRAMEKLGQQMNAEVCGSRGEREGGGNTIMNLSNPGATPW